MLQPYFRTRPNAQSNVQWSDISSTWFLTGKSFKPGSKGLGVQRLDTTFKSRTRSRPPFAACIASLQGPPPSNSTNSPQRSLHARPRTLAKHQAASNCDQIRSNQAQMKRGEAQNFSADAEAVDRRPGATIRGNCRGNKLRKSVNFRDGVLLSLCFFPCRWSAFGSHPVFVCHVSD